MTLRKRLKASGVLESDIRRILQLVAGGLQPRAAVLQVLEEADQETEALRSDLASRGYDVAVKRIETRKADE